MPRVTAAAVGSMWFVLALAGCGGDASPPVCGDGVVGGNEQCDKGDQNGKPDVNCDKSCHSISILIPQIQVSWGLLQHNLLVPDYKGTNCDAVGATGAHIILTGPVRIEEVLPCNRYGKLYAGVCPDIPDGGTGPCTMHLPKGDYQVTLTLTRGEGDNTAVTSAKTTGKTTVNPGPVVQIFVDIEQEDFLTGYTGSLQLATSWGLAQATCAKAMPMVDKQAFRLVPMGLNKPVASMTVAGTKLDGTPAACFTPMGGVFTEEAKALPWGPYQLNIQGFSGGAQPSYCGNFDVFVGPSDNTQIWHPIVPVVHPAADGGAADGGCF